MVTPQHTSNVERASVAAASAKTGEATTQANLPHPALMLRRRNKRLPQRSPRTAKLLLVVWASGHGACNHMNIQNSDNIGLIGLLYTVNTLYYFVYFLAHHLFSPLLIEVAAPFS
jgi:hypothetical protein